MLVGIFVSKDKKKNENMIEILSNKFQGTEFIALQNLSDELSMASLAKGVFDRIIVYVAAFSGKSSKEISDELSSLRSYKEIRANNVRISVIDRPNPNTGEGILDLAYRKLFGSFVDCQYFIKTSLSTTDLVTLLRDVNFSSDRIESNKKSAKMNVGMVKALSQGEGRNPNYIDNSVELSEAERRKIQNDLRNGNNRGKTVKEETKQEVKETKQPVKETKVEAKPKAKRFSLFGRKKEIKEVQFQDEKVRETVKQEPIKEEVRREPVRKVREIEPELEPDASNEEFGYDEIDEHLGDNFEEDYREEYPKNDGIKSASVREAQRDIDFDDFEHRSVEGRINSKYKEVESAVSRNPEVVDNRNIEFQYRNVDEQRTHLNYGNSFGTEREMNINNRQFDNSYQTSGVVGTGSVELNGYDATNLFGNELGSADAIINKQLELKELELKARMLEAQARIKHTEYESNSRSALMRPARSDERVTGYVNSSQGRAKIILVTGLNNCGKTTLTKVVGEVLKNYGYVIDIDLDFDNRTLSDSFNRLDESDMTRLGVFRALRDLRNIQEYIVPIDGSLDIIGTLNMLTEEEENSLATRLDESLIQPMLRKLSNSGVYGYVVVDCPLELLNRNKGLLDIADDVLWCCRGSRHGISASVRELSKECYDENFFSRMTIILNGEKEQLKSWRKFFNTQSMWSDDICDKLGAIVPYIEDYEDYFYEDVTGLEFDEFKSNLLEILRLN